MILSIRRTGLGGDPCMDLNPLGKRIEEDGLFIFNPSIAAGNLEGTS